VQACGAATKRATVEAALRLTVQLKNQDKIQSLFGKVQWDGDLDAMRQSRFPDWGDRLLTGEEAAHEEGAVAGMFSRRAHAEVDA